MGNFTINSAEVESPKTGIVGKVFGDQDSNGIYTNEDVLLEGIEVELYDSNDNLVSSTTTNVNGVYSFGSPAAGDYYIIVSSDFPVGYSGFTTQDAGPDDIDSDVDQITGQSDTFTLTGSNEIVIDAGLLPG